MCGICGIVYEDPTRVPSEHTLLAMRDALTHRGPDDSGHYLAPGVALGARRLAILDLSDRGHMPMCSPDGRYWITYNGEVYNHQQLRGLLKAQGHTFHSNTDTETVLNLYALEGPAMLERLNGMFAFAIWDSQERTLFLARDRMGIKPLYYSVSENAIYFASEEKALHVGGVPPAFDETKWEELLCFRYVAGENTPFVGVNKLLPGHYMLWRDGRASFKRWWHLAERARAVRNHLCEQPSAWFKETFDSAVSLRRISDVPIGVMLSGGLDSASVAASLARNQAQGLATFTVRFQEEAYDEGPLARQVADRCNLEYHDLTVPPEELLTRLREASWFSDEPLGHSSSLHILALSKYAKSRVSVLLSGEGSDEVLGGYVRYLPLRYHGLLNLSRLLLALAGPLASVNPRLQKLKRFLTLNSIERLILFNACDVLPSDLVRLGMNPVAEYPYREQLLSEAQSLYPDEPVRQAMYNDQHTFLCSLLDRNDRMTMGSSIECRVPFLDYRLVEGLAALPSEALLKGRRGKALLRSAVGGRLPEPVLNGRKWGFGVPWNSYLRNIPELRAFVASIPELPIVRQGPFDLSKLKLVISRFLAGEDTESALINQLVMVSIWHETYFQRVAELTSKDQVEDKNHVAWESEQTLNFAEVVS